MPNHQTRRKNFIRHSRWLFGLGTLCIATSTLQADTNENVYLGFKWRLGESWKPITVIGYRHADIEFDGDVSGHDAGIGYNFEKGNFDKIRIKAFDGDEHLQAEIAAGFALDRKSWFVGIGAQGRYVTLDVDYVFKHGWETDLGINSIDDYERELIAAPVAEPEPETPVVDLIPPPDPGDSDPGIGTDDGVVDPGAPPLPPE